MCCYSNQLKQKDNQIHISILYGGWYRFYYDKVFNASEETNVLTYVYSLPQSVRMPIYPQNITPYLMKIIWYTIVTKIRLQGKQLFAETERNK